MSDDIVTGSDQVAVLDESRSVSEGVVESARGRVRLLREPMRGQCGADVVDGPGNHETVQPNRGFGPRSVVEHGCPEEGTPAAIPEASRARHGNALRAGVLGSTDGLVSNLCLVMGVAGSGAPHQAIVVAGLAGLVAGSLSMALGEYLSVQSARELLANELRIEAGQLAASPTRRSPSCAASTSGRASHRGWRPNWPTTWSVRTQLSLSTRWRARSWGSTRTSLAVRRGWQPALPWSFSRWEPWSHWCRFCWSKAMSLSSLPPA